MRFGNDSAKFSLLFVRQLHFWKIMKKINNKIHHLSSSNFRSSVMIKNVNENHIHIGMWLKKHFYIINQIFLADTSTGNGLVRKCAKLPTGNVASTIVRALWIISSTLVRAVWVIYEHVCFLKKNIDMIRNKMYTAIYALVLRTSLMSTKTYYRALP